MSQNGAQAANRIFRHAIVSANKIVKNRLKCLTFARVNPDVSVFNSPSLSHFSLVTCLATKLCVDLMVGNSDWKRNFTLHILDTFTYYTALQSIMNAKLSKHRFWHCHENGLIKTIQTIPHNLYLSVKLTFLYCGLRLILVYPNPQ